jgi:xanthine dehydrogenase accessory factor
MKKALFDALAAALAEERSCVLATVLGGAAVGRQLLFFGDGAVTGEAEGLPLEALQREALSHLERGASGSVTLPAEEASDEADLEIFFESHRPLPLLLLIGAVHAAIPLVHFARQLDFRTVVIDPRGTFASPERFAHADELRRQWPQQALAEIPLHEETYLATLSHDPKIDLPALEAVLRSPVRYIGALGSKKTHGKRVAALREKGFSEAEIARIHAPIGLDLGGRSPAEIALAVIAEIVAVRNGRGQPRSP